MSVATHNNERPVPWVEKYRPQKLDGLVHQPHVTRFFQSFDAEPHRLRNMPHVLFHGPAGSGKTTVAMALVNQWFSGTLTGRVLVINASDERGIGTIREKLKSFLLVKSLGVGAKSCVPFKVVVLDEADSLTPDAQAALRAMMEEYAETTRFFILCNYVSRIIGPILSRCSAFKFHPIPVEHALQHLSTIMDNEDVRTKDNREDCLKMLLEVSNGDMRQAIHLLQSVSRLSQMDGFDFTMANIEYLSGQVDVSIVQQFLMARNIASLRSAIENFSSTGCSTLLFLEQMSRAIVTYKVGLSDLVVAQFLIALTETHSNIIAGASSRLQLLQLGKILCNKVHHD